VRLRERLRDPVPLRLRVSVPDADVLWDGDSEGDISSDADADDVTDMLGVPLPDTVPVGDTEGVAVLVCDGVLMAL
jgi:hypothetical protein